ncbi:MAG: hypothetical protein ACRC78_16610, partial [Planktothrix sp.]
MGDLTKKLQQANHRLKTAKIKVSIEEVGDRLVLRATLPDRDGGKSYQQRIFTRLTATPIGLQEAERRAKQLRNDLDGGNFRWEDWSKSQVFGGTAG